MISNSYSAVTSLSRVPRCSHIHNADSYRAAIEMLKAIKQESQVRE